MNQTLSVNAPRGRLRSQYLSLMARLIDITLYEQFYPAEGQRQFQLRANHVSGLYLQCLRGYKPPKTTRISISMVPNQ